MKELHIVLFPAMAHGHMIPMTDMAKLFTSRGIKTTIIATPSFSPPITKAQNSGHDLHLVLVQFPPPGSSLPENITSLDQISTPHLLTGFLQAMDLLQDPIETILQDLHPSCLISDMLLPWTADSAAKFGIPRLVFFGTSCFARCTHEHMELHKPWKKVSSDSDTFLVPGLPNELSFARSQVPPFSLYDDEEDDFVKLFKRIDEAVKKTYGEVMNTFYELEPAYADHFKNVLGRKSWHIGPLLLCSNKGERKLERRNESAIDEHKCLAWLDVKKSNTVVYACFGSIVTFTDAQLHETAAGLEASGQDFIWVVRKEGSNQDWLPEGFEERVKGRGLIIRRWAPQVMILDHPAIGAFVTHCGWNSTLEGICAGVPMVTWPVYAEQFYNEKLVTEVLGTGVSVGNKRWIMVKSEGVSRDAVAKAVEQIMVGEEAAEMRIKARYYKEMAKKAVEEGGSSHNNLKNLIEELKAFVPQPSTKQEDN